jgi:DNA-binding response OmpR family regulator
VPSGKDAFAFLRKEPPFQNAPSPALILLDLNLPGMKGAAVLTQLRSLPAYQATPVIVFSGNEQVVEETRYLQLGANAYVEKTADFVTYLTRIQAIMKDWLGADCPPP